ncbi:acetyl-CoA acetyltransferase [Rhizobium sp. BK313]|nr:acetyl-CoA acetyltransferase [Rhizobium sp. BK313]
MTNAPFLPDRARGDYRLGHGRVVDHVFPDGLEDASDKGRLMGTFEADQFTRTAQDDYAITSLTCARNAIEAGAIDAEIIAVTVKAGRCELVVSRDEQPGEAKLEKIPTLKPAFRENGTVPVANASSISGGAAALVLMWRSQLSARASPRRMSTCSRSMRPLQSSPWRRCATSTCCTTRSMFAAVPAQSANR